MAIQILPEKPGWGQLLGTGLGSGLSQGLQQLAQQKLGQMQQQRQASQLEQALSSAGIDPQTARAVSMMPPNLQAEYVKNMRRQSQGAALQQQLGGLVPGGQQPSGLQQLAGLGAQAQPEGIGGLFGGAEIPLQQQVDVAKLRQEQAKETRKSEREKWEYHKDFLKDTYKKLEGSKKNITRFDTLGKLAESGNLSHPMYYSLLKKVGLDIPTLLNPGKKGSTESELYNKTVQDFVKDIKDVFGARITEKQIEVFLKSLPTLENTDAGKKLIIQVMKLKENATQSKGKAIQDIINESGGIPPYDMQAKVHARLDDIYDQLGTDINSAIDASTSLVEGPKSLVGKTVDANFSVPDGAEGTTPDGTPVVMVNGKWVPKSRGAI